VGYPTSVLQPNSLVLTLLGAGLLWFGWFGFNGGSALASNSTAGLAFTTTQFAAVGGALSWMLAEWLKHGRPTSMGLASGLVAGLVTVTPAAGFLSPAAGLLIGIIAGIVCFRAVLAKAKLGYDDSLDAFGVHGVGGMVGALLTGVLVSKEISGSEGTLMKQAVGVGFTIVYCGIVTFIILKIVDLAIGLRVSEDEEREGLDISQHGEHVE
jgi:ammonium transporter, Amt family